MVTIARRKLSLRTQIFYRTAPIALVLFVVASFYSDHEVRTEVRRQIASHVDADTVSFGELVERKLALSVDACAAVATNDIVINSIIDLEHRRSILPSFIRSIRLPGAEVRNVVMTDYQGVPIASKHPVDAGAFGPQLRCLPQVMRGQQWVEIHAGDLVIAQPVMYGGRPEAVVVATFPANDFFEDLCVGTDTSVAGIAYDSKTIACSTPECVDDGGRLTHPDEWFVQSIAISSMPGLTATIMRSNTVANNAARAVRHALVFQTVTAFALLIAGLWFATSMATRTIHDFLKAIDDVRSNVNLGRRVSFDSSAEFVRLGDRFNAMLEQIQNATVTREEYRIPALVAKYTDNAVIVTDPAGQIEWVNEGFTALTGYQRDEVLGYKPGTLLQGPGTDPAAIDAMRAAILKKRGVNVEILNYDKAGKEYWVDVEIRAIRDDAGNVVNFIAIESDITARVRAEAEKRAMNSKLVRLSRQAGIAEVATGVLHNVGNALNSVNTSAGLLQRWLTSSRSRSLLKVAGLLEEHDHDLASFLQTERGSQVPLLIRRLADALQLERETYEDEAERLIRSVEHIKQIVAKQQSNARRCVVQESVQLSELVSESLRIRSQCFEHYGVEVRQDLSPVPEVYADRHMVIEILVNLLGNAANAFEESSTIDRRIEITIHAHDDDAVDVVVADNGIGISQENQVKIFSHGFTTRKDGHGFGLHSSVLAAESMGGALSVSSDGIGRGAAFTLRLPTALVEAT